MDLEAVRVSSAQFWGSAIVTGLIVLGLVALLLWRIKPSHFRQLRWALVVSAAVFWSAFSLILVRIFWDSYYEYLYPPWFGAGGILVFVPLLYGLFAFSFHWLALRLPGHPLISFCILCGIESVLEHVGGIYGMNITQLPVLQEASPASILAFSFPEYILYWCIVIAIAATAHSLWIKIRPAILMKKPQE